MKDSLTQKNSAGHKPEEVVFPFSLEIDPMEKLLLVNFENDPDSTYLGFEPQVFNDDVNGAGHLILGWRTDKKVDVYHQKSLNPDPSRYSIAGAGLNEMVATDMEKAFYEVTDVGVQAHYTFNDKFGRAVEILIREKNQRKRKPFGLLAPMGDAATHPTTLPIVMLHDFYFVRKNKTTIKVSINGKSHKPDDLPMPMDWQKMTFARYSPRPLIATLNPAYNGTLESFGLIKHQHTFEKEDAIYEIEWAGEKASIRSMSKKKDMHLLTIRFTPSFPCMNAILPNTQHKGNFTISGDVSAGSISGSYIIQKEKESIHIRVVPSKGWKPKTTKFSTWFLFTVASVFKKWPTTYQWDANLEKNREGLWYMASKWTRTGRILKD